MTAELVSASVEHNSVPLSELSVLLRSVNDALAGLSAGGKAAVDPAVAAARRAFPAWARLGPDGRHAHLSRLADAGLQAEVLARCTVPFGPVMRLRAAMLEARRLVGPGQRDEELVVIGARRAP